MNILEIAKECGACRIFSKTEERWALNGNEVIEAFAAAISAKAIDDYKSSLVPVQNILWSVNNV